MAYQEALEASGATVHEFKEFGSYQGEWWALVTYGGVRGWVSGSYGSCSGCDAFEAEFGYKDPTPEGLARFGLSYLEDGLKTQEQAETEAAKSIGWDFDAAETLAFIKGHPA